MTLIAVALLLLFVGSIADVPVMFLALQGTIPLAFVFIVGFLADIIPDFFWYWLGQKISKENLQKLWFFKNKPHRLENVGKALDKYGAFILFGSKFVYAFGIPTQVMAGAHKYKLPKFVLANALGSAGWLLLLYSLAHFFTSSDIVEDYLRNGKIALAVFLIVAFGLYYLLDLCFKRFFTGKE